MPPSSSSGPDFPPLLAALQPTSALLALRPFAVVGRPCIDLHLDRTERPLPASTAPHYPRAGGLEAQLAAQLAWPAAGVMVTCGADEALDRACRIMLGPGRMALLTRPTFAMLPHYVRLTGAEVSVVPWPGADFPAGELTAALTPAVRLVAIVSPNNPTGAVASAAAVRALAAAAPQALILLDLAYGDYAEEDLTSLASTLANVLVVRTLSKAWGVPGLRVGYAVGHPQVVTWLRTAGGPYSVAAPSLDQAGAQLAAAAPAVAAHVRAVRAERRELTAALVDLGAEVVPSQANFVLLRHPQASWWQDALAGLGIGSCAFPDEPSMQHALRLTCPGDAPSLARLLRGLRAAAAPQAMLFDMDGVLADVSGSFRRAIVATAASFGAQVELSEVAEMKAAGNANNDWRVTQRLLAMHGIDVDLAAVTEQFETLYNGTLAVPGLFANERLTIPPALLARWAARLPLAVVTGRPRADAERFLYNAQIAKHFTHLICMEDAPLKPNPAPVQLALTRLGVQDAWMIGDTPDDVRAARGAAVVPIGVVAPGADGLTLPAALAAAGAARILRNLADLEALWPS